MLDVTCINVCNADSFFHGFRLRRGHIYGNSHKHGYFVTSLMPSKHEGYYCAYLCTRNSREWKKVNIAESNEIIVASFAHKRHNSTPPVGDLSDSRFHATAEEYSRHREEEYNFKRDNNLSQFTPVFKRSSSEYFGEGKIPYAAQPVKHTFLETYDGYKKIQQAGRDQNAQIGPAELLANNGITPYDAPKPVKYGEPEYAHTK
jgi:hypothetical protein